MNHKMLKDSQTKKTHTLSMSNILNTPFKNSKASPVSSILCKKDEH